MTGHGYGAHKGHNNTPNRLHELSQQMYIYVVGMFLLSYNIYSVHYPMTYQYHNLIILKQTHNVVQWLQSSSLMVYHSLTLSPAPVLVMITREIPPTFYVSLTIHYTSDAQLHTRARLLSQMRMILWIFC